MDRIHSWLVGYLKSYKYESRVHDSEDFQIRYHLINIQFKSSISPVSIQKVDDHGSPQLLLLLIVLLPLLFLFSIT